MKINCIGHIAETGMGIAYQMHVQALSTFLDTEIFSFQHPQNNTCNTYFHGGAAFAYLVDTPGRNIAYWVCESTKLSEDYFKYHERFSDIWTASKYCQSILSKELDREVKVVPHYVSRYRYAPKKHSTPVVLSSFDGFSRFERKNPIGTLQAVKAAMPDCVYIVKAKNLKPSYEAWLRKEAGDMDLRIINESISIEAMCELYAHADIFVSLHRAEGFGMQLLEAMAFGCKVVASDFGGCRDFLNHKNGYPVKCLDMPVWDEYFDGSWGEPVISHAVTQLKKAREDGFEKNQAAFETALRYSMTNTIKETLKAL